MQPPHHPVRDLQSAGNRYLVGDQVVFAYPIADAEPMSGNYSHCESSDGDFPSALFPYGKQPPAQFSLGFTIQLRSTPIILPDFITHQRPIRSPSPSPPPSAHPIPFWQRARLVAVNVTYKILCGWCSAVPKEEVELQNLDNPAIRVLPAHSPQPLNTQTIGRKKVATRLAEEFHRVVPESIRDHLVVVTPPPATIFPQLYPGVGTNDYRIWKSGENVWKEVGILFASGVPVISIPHMSPDKIGCRSIEPGTILFFKEIAYYVTKDIGELPLTPEFPERMVALEAHTIERTLVLVLLPRDYATTPIEFEEPIWGTEEIEEEAIWGSEKELADAMRELEERMEFEEGKDSEEEEEEE